MVTFKDQLYAWRGVIFALFLRELQSKFNDKFGLGWAFLEPFAFIFALSYLRGLISGDDIHSIPLFLFMMIGMVGLQSLTTCLQSVSTSVRRNKPLYALEQVQPISAILTANTRGFSKGSGCRITIFALYLMGGAYGKWPVAADISVSSLLGIFNIHGVDFCYRPAFVPEVDKIKSFLPAH